MDTSHNERDTAQQSPPPCRPLPGIEATFKYPANRKSFFAIKYIRRLQKQAYANRIGPEACWLLGAIAMQEDETGYERPVDFFNGQLLDRCGFADDRALERIRRKCIESGLLHYTPSVKRKAGLYWVIVPPQWEPFDGTYHTSAEIHPQNGGSIRQESVDQSARKLLINPPPKCLPSIPIPFPVSDPIPPPTIPADGGWNDLIERIRKHGLGKAKETIRDARRLNLTLSYITAVVEHYESLPGLWNAGAIRWRLTNEDAITFPPAEGWPPPNAVAQRQAQVDRMVISDRLKDHAEAQNRASDKERNSQLLLRFNDRLKALTPAEVQAMAEEDQRLKLALKTYGSGPLGFNARAAQLAIAKHLSQVAEPPR